MKLDSFIIMSKGASFVMIGFFSPWVAALGQWINSGEWPARIIWVGLILPLSVIGAASQWQSFCSGSWKEYRDQRKADISQQSIVSEVKPNPPPAAVAEPEKIKL